MHLKVNELELLFVLIQVNNEIHISLIKRRHLFINRLSSFHAIFHNKCFKACVCAIFFWNDTFHG